MDCIFCKIINKEIPCFKVYEDDFVLAFLDINPVAPGHTLIIPKKHFENIFENQEEYLKRIILVAQKISQKIKKEGIGEGVNLYQANGSTAEQVVPHFHLHVIPRNSGDAIDFNGQGMRPISKPSNQDFKEMKNKICLK
ncbi:MAG: HIT family protein [Candidatus Paceibacterota bacterium]|jgi:histidine triad (HIT) family protein